MCFGPLLQYLSLIHDLFIHAGNFTHRYVNELKLWRLLSVKYFGELETTKGPRWPCKLASIPPFANAAYLNLRKLKEDINEARAKDGMSLQNCILMQNMMHAEYNACRSTNMLAIIKFCHQN